MAEIPDEGLHGISASGNSHSQCVGSKARKPAEVEYQHPSRPGNIFGVCAMTETNRFELQKCCHSCRCREGRVFVP